MAVRNIRPLIGNKRPIPVYSPIPPSFSPIWKIELVDSSGNIYDITDYIDDGEFSDGVTDSIGDFNFRIIDPNKTYSSVISNFDYVKIYMDYGTTATTLRFKGVIEKTNRKLIYFEISGRSIAMIVTGKNLIYSATKKKRSDVITEILNTNFPSINTDNIESDTTIISVNYSEVSFQNIIEDLCGKHHDFYIDKDLNANYFVSGSKENKTEAVTQDYNHISTEGYGSDSENTVTRVRVYGKKVGDISLFATSSSSTEHTNGIAKDRKITDKSIITTDQATERANFEYENNIAIPNIGSITSVLLPTLSPGEKLFIELPIDGIAPGYYTINSYTHSFPSLETKLIIQGKKLNIPQIIKSNINLAEGATEDDNPYNLDFSIIITFDESSGTNQDTVINEDRLKVKPGSSTGTWRSDVYKLPSDVKTIAFKMTGDNLIKQYSATTSNLWYSLDGGTTEHIYVIGAGTEIPSGTDLRIRIDLNSSDARVEAVGFMYSLK